jgi:hypothetical protein
MQIMHSQGANNLSLQQLVCSFDPQCAFRPLPEQEQGVEPQESLGTLMFPCHYIVGGYIAV